MPALITSPSFYVTLAVNGAVLGALFGLIAVGVVTVYRTTRTLNLAQGGLATLGASFYLSLRLHGVNTVVALVATTVLGAVVGLGVGQLVGWPLRRATPTSKLVASLGVLLLAQAVIAIAFGTTPRIMPPLVSRSLITVSGVTIVSDKILIVALAVAGVALLGRVFTHSRIGLHMRAVALDPEAAALQGVNVRMVILASWMLGVAVAFAGGVLLTTALTEVSPLALTLVLLQALAATLLGRLESLGFAMVGGLILGELVVLFDYFFLQISGISDIAIFGFILVLLLVQRRSSPLTERA